MESLEYTIERLLMFAGHDPIQVQCTLDYEVIVEYKDMLEAVQAAKVLYGSGIFSTLELEYLEGYKTTLIRCYVNVGADRWA